jgi:hypothetical protein
MKFPIKMRQVIKHIPSGMCWTSRSIVLENEKEFDAVEEKCNIVTSIHAENVSIPSGDLFVYLPVGVLQQCVVYLEEINS